MSETSVCIVTLGCPKNQVDSEYLASSVQMCGYSVIHGEKFADIVLLNTCGFIQDAKEQSIEVILEYSEARKERKIKKLVVFGCLVERYKEQLKSEITDVDAWFGVNKTEDILRYIHSSISFSRPERQRLLSTPSHYAYLKISEGCNRKCSFCVIPDIRGKYISRPIEDIVSEAIYLTSIGVKEIIIIAQDTTYYGRDLYMKPKLPELMEELALRSGAEWLRLLYAYPSEFPEELADVIAKYDNICKYIDIPFQHVDNVVLEKMKRGHTCEDIEHLIYLLRKKIPDIHIRTSFITGFPGESEKEFRKLQTFLKKYKIERAGFFTYSHEEGTTAEILGDDVNHKTKLKRINKLIKIQEKISLKKNRAEIGSVIKIIVDEVYEKHLLGRTEFDAPEIDNLITVHLRKKHRYNTGDFAMVRIIGAEAFDLIAEPI